MTTTKVTGATALSGNAIQHATPVTWGWVLRRSALWAGIMVVAVGSACLLYAVASNAGSHDQLEQSAAVDQ